MRRIAVVIIFPAKMRSKKTSKHFSQDVTNNSSFVVFGNIWQLGPRQAVINIIFHLVVLGETRQITLLHLWQIQNLSCEMSERKCRDSCPANGDHRTLFVVTKKFSRMLRSACILRRYPKAIPRVDHLFYPRLNTQSSRPQFYPFKFNYCTNPTPKSPFAENSIDLFGHQLPIQPPTNHHVHIWIETWLNPSVRAPNTKTRSRNRCWPFCREQFHAWVLPPAKLERSSSSHHCKSDDPIYPVNKQN